jgi:HD-GYP domain-containing protein (c-di-GMP phosphodiesterase class II)
MYIAKLDCPWLETPFVFQGFEIRDHIEIEQLQACCQTVYVDTDRGKLSEAQVQSLLAENNVATSAYLSDDEPAGQTPVEAGRPGVLSVLLWRVGLGPVLGLAPIDKAADSTIISTVRGEASQANDAYERLLVQDELIRDRARNEGLVDIDGVLEAVTPMIESVFRNPNAIAWTVFSKKLRRQDYSRSAATSVWAVMLGRQLGFDEDALRDLAVGGMLLDIGYANVSDEVLTAEGAISDEQYEHLSRHVLLGLEILRGSKGVSQNVLDMVKCHHERTDGSGYPDKLSGNDIPIYGRIAGIIDCYDAMTTKTSYSTAKAGYDAARELNEMRGQQFPAEVVEQFIRTIGMFPTGSVVELSDGTIAVVLEQNTSNPLLPKIMVLLDEHHVSLSEIKIIDLKETIQKSTGRLNIWIQKGLEHGAFGIDPSNYFSDP